MLGQMSGRFVQCCGIGRDVFGKARVVQRFAPFPQGADDGYADTAHQHAQEIRQAAGGGNLPALHVRQCDGSQRQEEHGNAYSLPKLRPDDVADIHVGIKIGAPIESEGKGQEAGGYEQAHIDFIAEPAD